MTLNKQAGLSIIELILYTPCLPFAFFVCKRHGFGRNSGFIFTLTLCLIRIVGASCQLINTSAHSTGLFTAVLILQSLGLSQLIFATLGLLSRCLEALSMTPNSFSFTKPLRLLQFVLTAAIIITVIGEATNIKSHGKSESESISKVGIVLFFAAYVGTSLLSLLALLKIGKTWTEERKFALATAAAIPFLGVRVLYAMLEVFSRLELFEVTASSTGAVLVRVFMEVLVEIVVIGLYLGVGWRTKRADSAREREGVSYGLLGPKGESGPKHRQRGVRAVKEEQELGVERLGYGDRDGSMEMGPTERV